VPSFDYGGFVVGEKPEVARLLCKQNGVLCGVPFVDQIFKVLNCAVSWNNKEGDWIDTKNGNVEVAYVTGPARMILLGERTALNLLARASGIATRARQVKELVDKEQYKGKVAGTRKTTPGFRLVEKYAMIVGGVDAHRHDLSSMIMLKDNHIESSGNISEAVTRARLVGGFSIKIEVECKSEQEAEEAMKAGADIVMLDNFPPEKLKVSAEALKKKYPHVLIEASGGITLSTLVQFFSPHVDIISMGSIHQGVPHIDLSLKIMKKAT